MKFGRLSAITALVLALGVVNIPAAHALTDYDSLVTETQLSRLTLPLPDACSTTDFSLNWMQGFDSVHPSSSFPDSVREDIKEAFLDTADLSTAAWSLSMKPSAYGGVFGAYAYSTVTLFFVSDATDVTTQFHLEHHGSGIYANQLRLEAVPNSVSDYSWGVVEFRVDSSDCTLKMINGNTGVSTSWGGVYTVASKLISYGDRFSTQNNEFLFSNFAVDYPVGYEGELVPSTYVPPVPTYVAMGDSFSSGEGNSPFEAGTDTSTNRCHRSEVAYPYWINQTPGLVSEPMAFVACSGATTSNVLYGGSGEGAWNELPQVDALSEETEVITITVGGNDIGFKDFATECGLSSCDSSTAIYIATMAAIHDDLPSKLVDVLTEIASRTGEAKVFVIGYPHVTPELGVNNLPYQCNYLNSSAGAGLDSLAARDVVTELNSIIDDTVDSYVNTSSDTTFLFVDPNTSVGGTFDGHDICQGVDSYFHNVAPNDYLGNGYREKIFHPNVSGQYEYYSIVRDAIENN